MDCPKFIPNIFNPTKCSQCFKIKEEHHGRFGSVRCSNSSPLIHSHPYSTTMATPNTLDSTDITPRILLKCGHLFIAPIDYLPQDIHFKNKRWQRRWFSLFDTGELSYSLDEYDAIPQGTLVLSDLTEVLPAEEITGHQYSILIKSPNISSTFLKVNTGDDYRKWIRILSKFSSNPHVPNLSSIRRSSSSCASSSSNLEEPSPEPKELIQQIERKVVVSRVRSYASAYEKSNLKSLPEPNPSPPTPSNNTISTASAVSRLLLSKPTPKARTTLLPRGDPDGGEQIVQVDNGIPADRLRNEVRTKLQSLKSQLVTKKGELDKVKNESILKSDKLLIDNLKLQVNSYFIEIDKLNYLVSYTYNDLRESLLSREKEVEDLKSELEEEMSHHYLADENKLLVERINDLTEKYYTLDKSHKVLKTKLHRYRTNSLKDKDVEKELCTKIEGLETRISNYYLSNNGIIGGCSENSSNSIGTGTSTITTTTTSSISPEPSSTPQIKSASSSLINVIVKLNELEKRMEESGPPTEWYKCSNCDYLQSEINERDSKLNELETMVTNLESRVSYINSLKVKYNEEVQSLRSLTMESIGTLDESYKCLLRELEEKHQIQLTQFQIKKEEELQEETRATKNALELLKKNYEMELQSELNSLRQEWIIKYHQKGLTLEQMHLEHEDITSDLRHQIIQLTDKYTNKCLEFTQLEEKFRHMT